MSADELGALPTPVLVGPEPQALRPIAYAAKNTDLLLADAVERSRAAEWPWDMWCRICHIRPTSHRTEAEALEAADRHVHLCHAPQAEVHRLMTAGGLAEFDRLRARVAELEAERHATNEALSDAAERMRADRDGIAELEALTPAAIQTCRKCGAGYTYGEPCSSCEFRKRMAAELQARGLDGEHYPFAHHDYGVSHDLPETGGAGRG